MVGAYFGPGFPLRDGRGSTCGIEKAICAIFRLGKVIDRGGNRNNSSTQNRSNGF